MIYWLMSCCITSKTEVFDPIHTHCDCMILKMPSIMLWTASHGNSFLNQNYICVVDDLSYRPRLSFHLIFCPISRLVMASPKSAVLRRKLDAVNDNLSNSKRLLAQLTALDDYKAIHDDYLDTVFCICSNEPIWWVLSCWNLTIPLLIIISLDWKLLLWDNKHNQIPIWWWCYL